jgi:ABC-type Fe3+ transport system substrate-binding protein
VVNWKAIHTAVASPQGWPAIGGKSDWGFVKLGHTDPTRSNSGIQALWLMTLEFYGKKGGIDVGEILKPDYQTFVKETEKGVTKFETSTGTFMTEMVLYGPSKYDIAVVYENLAIAQVENAQGRWGNLKVYYPPETVWSDHPIVLIDQPWVTAKQKDAAKKWVDFLRARPQQELALKFGFRPSDPSVPLKSADPNNPFNKLAGNGVKVDLPPVAETPTGPVVRAMMTMWSRLVAK